MHFNYSYLLLTVLFLTTITLLSCGTSAPAIFGRKTLHEQYGQRINNAGLRETGLGRLWFRAAEQSISQPLTITVPYSETGYFAAEKPAAVGLKFAVRRGEKLNITLEKRPDTAFAIYLDLWEAPSGTGKPKWLAGADTSGKPIEVEVKNEGMYILRVQPELLKSGEYTVSINAGPSLAFPVSAAGKGRVGSYWGAGRDRGARKHEGIDIFAPFRTPAVAAADGVVTRVNQNNLGGKVVWFRPRDRDYTLYYAHLDSQMVADGQVVKEGDTLGLIGNTGNARTTPPHLHFGIYASGGAVDPFPFVNTLARVAPPVTAPLSNLGKIARVARKKASLHDQPSASSGNTRPLETNTLLTITGAAASWYKAVLPDGQTGYIHYRDVAPIAKALKNSRIVASAPMFDQPDSAAARKATLSTGQSVAILAVYGNYNFVENETGQQGWMVKPRSQQGL